MKSKDLFPFYVILLHVPHDGVNNPLRKVFLGLTCFSFCSLLNNFYYLSSVLLSYLHELLQSRSTNGIIFWIVAVIARHRWVVILVFFHLFYAAWRGQVRLSSFSGRLWLSLIITCSVRDKKKKKKERNAVRQLVMNNFEFFALFHLSCVSKPGYRICKLFRFDVCMSFITVWDLKN